MKLTVIEETEKTIILAPGYYTTPAKVIRVKDKLALETYRHKRQFPDSESNYLNIVVDPSTLYSKELANAKKISKKEFEAELEICFEEIRKAMK